MSVCGSKRQKISSVGEDSDKKNKLKVCFINRAMAAPNPFSKHLAGEKDVEAAIVWSSARSAEQAICVVVPSCLSCCEWLLCCRK